MSHLAPNTTSATNLTWLSTFTALGRDKQHCQSLHLSLASVSGWSAQCRGTLFAVASGKSDTWAMFLHPQRLHCCSNSATIICDCQLISQLQSGSRLLLLPNSLPLTSCAFGCVQQPCRAASPCQRRMRVLAAESRPPHPRRTAGFRIPQRAPPASPSARPR